MPTTTTVNVSTSVVLVDTSQSNAPYFVDFPNISTVGRLITVRDNAGFASLLNGIVLRPISGATFNTAGNIEIDQPFGFVTLTSADNGLYNILNTFAFPAGQAVANISNLNAQNVSVTNTITASTLTANQQILVKDQLYSNVYNSLTSSNNNFYINTSTIVGNITSSNIQSTVNGLGTAGYLSSIVIPPPILEQQYIAVGLNNSNINGNALADGTIIYGTTGTSWQNAIYGTSIGFNSGGLDIVSGNDLFVAVGSASPSTNTTAYIQYSREGSNWSNANLALTSNDVKNRVIYANQSYVATGYSNDGAGGPGTIITSADGSNWLPATTGGFVGGYGTGLAYGAGVYVASGVQTSNTLAFSMQYSTNGSNWNAANTIAWNLGQVWDVTFNGNIFIALVARTTNNRNICVSGNGSNWTDAGVSGAVFPVNSNAGGFIAANQNIVIATASNNAPSGQMMYYSVNGGYTWQPNTFWSSGRLGRPVWDGANWWVGYYNPASPSANGLWHSANGINWNNTGQTAFGGGMMRGLALRSGTLNFGPQLVSTVGGLQSSFTTQVLNAGLISTAQVTTSTVRFVDITSGALQNLYVNSGALFLNNSEIGGATLTSTVAGLGSAGYISSTQLRSTVGGLGTAGYISSSQLTSTVAGINAGGGGGGEVTSNQLFSTTTGILTFPTWTMSTLTVAQNTNTSTLRTTGGIFMSSLQIMQANNSQPTDISIGVADVPRNPGLGQTATIAIGPGAGYFSQLQAAIAIGFEAGLSNQALQSVAIGNQTASYNQGNYGVAIGLSAGYSNQQFQSVAIGGLAGQESQGESCVAIGWNAAFINQQPNSIAIGEEAGGSNQNQQAIAIGFIAGRSNQGTYAIAIGRDAGAVTQGENSVALGYFAANISQGSNAIAIGKNAGTNTQSIGGIAIGTSAGSNLQGLNTVAIGVNAGYSNQRNASVAIGDGAGQFNQSNFSVAIGPTAGGTTQGQYSVAMGFSAGNNIQADNAIAIGKNAGTNGQNNGGIAIGLNAGSNSQGTNAVAIGAGAGNSNQQNFTVAIGNAAATSNQVQFAVAIGSSAGADTQGEYAVAIGSPAGYIAQKSFAVSIGRHAGSSNQGNGGVTIGPFAGSNSQGNFSIAIGSNAGLNSQGTQAIAIGLNAGTTSQHNNTMILSATGTALNSAGTNRTYIAPIRQNDFTTESGFVLAYTTANEVCQTSNNTLTLSNGNVGIGLINPATQLQLSLDSASKPTSQNWTISSDRRIKENIEDANLDICYSDIQKMRIRRFNFISSFEEQAQIRDKRRLGVIAQEVQQIIPKMVEIHSNYGFEDFHMVNTDQLNYAHFGATQKLMSLVEQQASTIASLVEQVSTLRG